MSLESGEFIKDLVRTNPVTATDPVTEGSNHLQLVKKCLQNSFPNFVGTAAVPAFVNYSEAQLNDAALKSVAQTIAGAWNFSATLTTQNIIGATCLFGPDVSVTAATNESARVNIAEGGLGVVGATLHYDGLANEFYIETGNNGALPRMIFDRDSYLVQAANSGGVFSEIAKLGAAQTVTGTWGFSEQVTISKGIKLGVGQWFSGASIDLLQQNASNFVQLGSSAHRTQIFGSNIDCVDNTGAIATRVLTKAEGSLFVYDLNSVGKKAGFRNPSNLNIASGESITQSDEGGILNYAGGTGTITIPALEALTAVRVIHRGSGPLTLAQSGVTINWRNGDGSGGVTGNRVVTPNSVVEFWWRGSTVVEIFGNGIS